MSVIETKGLDLKKRAPSVIDRGRISERNMSKLSWNDFDPQTPEKNCGSHLRLKRRLCDLLLEKKGI